MREQAAEEHTPDARLADALRPAVDAALLNSVRQEPRVWAEVLFPVLLPAVGIAVASALRGMVQTLNQVLEQSLSLRSWKWRFEAWRTRKTFAEVVLLRTLVYRVEQLLLVDRRTGVLLASVAASDVIPRDEQQISAMLTALQDFVADSFSVDAAAGIREIHVGDFSVFVEMGPRAALAAAVRGTAPTELLETLRAAIDLIHQEFASELRELRGDPKPFERSRMVLEGCLRAQYQETPPPSYARVWVMASIVLLALGWWVWNRTTETRRWERAIAALQNAHGIAVTHSALLKGRRVLRGFSDPLATPPDVILRESGIDLRRVSLHFQHYVSLEPELVIKRARVILGAPETVVMSLDGGAALKGSGAAPHAWILRARSAIPQLTLLGVQAVQVDQIVDQDMESLRGEIESAGVLFDVDSSQFKPEQLRVGTSLAAKSRRWIEYARELGSVPRVRILGYADSTGSEQRNVVLSRERAERVANLLTSVGIAPGLVSIEHPGQSPAAAGDLSLQRRAIIRLSLR